jgi:Kef-type K+ transport system membrane component KefB
MDHLVKVLLFLALATVTAKGAGALSVRLRQPAVFGEILAGLVLGPSLLNVLGWSLFASRPEGFVSHPDLGGLVHDMAEIGVVLLMFVAGMETDLEEMRRIGHVAFWAALGGVILPLASGAGVARLFGYGWAEGLFMGAVLTATSVSISAQTLMEIGSLRSKEGSTILGAAVIDDVMGIIVLSLLVAFAGDVAPPPPADVSSPPAADAISAVWGAASGVGAVLWIALRITLFFGLAWVLGRRHLERVTGVVSRLPVSEPVMALVVAVAFLYGWAAEALGGVASITGSYMAGILFARTSFREPIERGIRPLAYSFFVPLFLVNIGLHADITQLGSRVPLTLIVIGVAIAAKVAGCGLAARLAGFSGLESYRVGVGMISRGEVGLIIAGYGLAHGIIDNDVFSAMVLMVLVTTMIAPIWLRYAFPLQRG